MLKRAKLLQRCLSNVQEVLSDDILTDMKNNVKKNMDIEPEHPHLQDSRGRGAITESKSTDDALHTYSQIRSTMYCDGERDMQVQFHGRRHIS
ncbi:hypothetical protein T07_10302 [Trichinella nelsoni]|uniref:Uncharacterized protein n=1 Tax=Trichinella nelsoni TaxID=6336 RepID=A0A0V0S1N5_9BILA|nr:hypothetical protein T07_10302 [Trichinella nelsoni]